MTTKLKQSLLEMYLFKSKGNSSGENGPIYRKVDQKLNIGHRLKY